MEFFITLNFDKWNFDFSVHNPYNNQIYMSAALVESVLLLQWYEPMQKFMIVKVWICFSKVVLDSGRP